MSSAEPAVDLWTLSDLCTPWCIRVVATLHIAEHIASGVTDVAALAAATASDTDALHSVLSYLVARGVFIEEVPGRFALNDTARGLLNAGLFLGLDGIGGRMTHVWSTLPAYVRTGKPGYADVFGAPFWDDLAAHPDVGADFDALMGICRSRHARPDAEARPRRMGGCPHPRGRWWRDRRDARRVAARSILIFAACSSIFPGSAARSQETFDAAGVADRVTVASAELLRSAPCRRAMCIS